jgi:hypothetical protein
VLARLGFVVEIPWIDREVAVGGVGGDSEIAVTDVQIDRLRADQHDGLPMRAESLERIEQHPPGGDVLRFERSFARHPRFLSSCR